MAMRFSGTWPLVAPVTSTIFCTIFLEYSSPVVGFVLIETKVAACQAAGYDKNTDCADVFADWYILHLN